MNPTRTLIKEILSKSKGTLFLILLFNISAAFVSTLQPLLFKDLFDDILPGRQIGTAAFYMLLLILIPVIYAALNSVTSYYNNELGNHLSKNLRLRLFSDLLQTPPRKVDSIGRGEIINRITLQVGMLCEIFVVDTLMSLVSNVILLIATLWIMFSMSAELTLAAMLSFPLCMYGFRRFRSKTERLDKQYHGILDKGLSYLNDFFTNLKAVHRCNGHQAEQKRWSDWNDEVWKISRQSRVFHHVVLNLVADTVVSLITGIIYGYSLYLILKGRISPGTLLAFIVILPRLYNIFKSLFTLNMDRSRMTVIINNLNDILELEKIESGARAPDYSRVPLLQMRNVSYRYAPEDSFGITDFNLDIQPGAFVGIIGLSGSGKSTIFELIHRYIEPDEGEICLDGVPIKELDLHELRQYVGYSPQKGVLWNKSILDNIIYPLQKEDMDEETWLRFNAAVEMAHVNTFVQAMPEQYDKKVEGHGDNLSGGEIQRILLARAFMNEPRILMLDEYTSALDAITESDLNDTLLNLKGKQTILVIAHRLSTVKSADIILVVEKGQIVEQGSPAELYARRGIYYTMVEKQKI
ncbi:ABC transporter ATP-binding protein [Paenibacillus tritici]|uniref:ABC transporter ATP-binding protein n=1 Tax=Paenibacillus tritici TaxID=1873425 RepID=A0ABX2DT22_9BACL|nr:ABC transporter ATP-binding protein [Paenibacillus tritici]NQX47805.1 ABC transporter ATP-binding protein [Paenibacillus tritici]